MGVIYQKVLLPIMNECAKKWFSQKCNNTPYTTVTSITTAQ
jgi:hypothetical protein